MIYLIQGISFLDFKKSLLNLQSREHNFLIIFFILFYFILCCKTQLCGFPRVDIYHLLCPHKFQCDDLSPPNSSCYNCDSKILLFFFLFLLSYILHLISLLLFFPSIFFSFLLLGTHISLYLKRIVCTIPHQFSLP